MISPAAGACAPAGARRRDLLLAALAVLLFAIVQAFVALHGTAVALQDDLTHVRMSDPRVALDLPLLWSEHNEHHLPLPRLVFVLLLRWTHDFRTATLLGPWLLAAATLAVALAVRRIRGRSTLADAFVPLVVLSLGQSENLLNGFQIVFLIPAALVAGLIAIVATSDGGPRPGQLAGASLLAVLASLCGAFGLLFALGAAAWLAACALGLLGAGAPEGRRWRTPALIAVLALAGIAVASAVGWATGRTGAAVPSGRAMVVAGQFLSQWLGVLAQPARLASGLACAALVIGALAVALLRARADRAGRAAWLGLAALLAAHVGVALAVGIGRAPDGEASGYADRYATLSAFGPVLAFVVASRLHAQRSARIAQALLGLVALAAWIANAGPSVRQGRERVLLARAIEADVARGRSYAEIAAAYVPFVLPDRAEYALVLLDLDRLGLAPFQRRAGPDPRLLLGRDPATGELHVRGRLDAGALPAAETWRGLDGVLLAPGTTLTFEIPARSQVVRGLYALRDGGADAQAASFVVEARDPGGAVVARHARALSGEELREQRVLDFGLDLGPPGARTLVVRFEIDGAPVEARGFVGEVRAR